MSKKDENLQEDVPHSVDIILPDGSIEKCEIYDIIDFENKTYALLIPFGKHDDDTEVVIMKLVDDDEENAHFEDIEDDDELTRVYAYIQSLNDEEDDEEE